MAAITHQNQRTETNDQPLFPTLTKYFSAQEQRRLVHDDVVAGETVGGILFGVITTGLVMGIVVVIAISLM